ncbi:glycosyl transferase family A [Rhizobium sp. R72]|uniref:glycosyltransferase family 2 protein n=1 Tax=unclassified Rhizobium TaxID=2613769 RepID=UPI000B536E8A|nr:MULTISPECIES: glycosyltransferase family 2 protein [unclassified Rhizobium]OWW05439.1 glycosyl transferase family A [Rhizobium sp. R72]OWW06496.1 glycosyl transferase family A [Rhizobium sp. R711]
MQQHQGVEAVVCIPTFRRPAWLARTLTSLVDQVTDFAFAIVVVDNDAANPAGARHAREFLATKDRPFLVLTEERQGNCYAINRAFGEAMAAFPDAEFLLMIDDDEMALPGWLAAIVGTAKRENADIVGGPVVREFEVPVSDAVTQHLLFGSIEGKTRTVDQIHGSGNCLIRRQVFTGLGSPLFDVRFNFLGGGDMEFFTRCRKAGFKTWWCAEAVIREFVPQERVSARFLMTRSLRTGSINYVIDRLHSTSATRVLAKNALSLGAGVFRSIALFIKTRRLLPASHPLLVSLGRTLASLGFLPAPYRASN